MILALGKNKISISIFRVFFMSLPFEFRAENIAFLRIFLFHQPKLFHIIFIATSQQQLF